MTVTALDDRTALVLVDLQKGTIGSHPMAHPADEVIGHAAEPADCIPCGGCYGPFR